MYVSVLHKLEFIYLLKPYYTSPYNLKRFKNQSYRILQLRTEMIWSQLQNFTSYMYNACLVCQSTYIKLEYSPAVNCAICANDDIIDRKYHFNRSTVETTWLDSGTLNNEWLCCQLWNSGVPKVLTLLSIPSHISNSYFTFWSCWEMRCGSLHDLRNVYHFPPELALWNRKEKPDPQPYFCWNYMFFPCTKFQ
jgi:hypothetical protein